MLILLAFTYIAPEVGVLFLCIAVHRVQLRLAAHRRRAQTAMIWTVMALGLAGLFLLTDKPIAMPHGSHLERFATMLVFVLTIGRCMFLGIFSSSLQQSLYQSGLEAEGSLQAHRGTRRTRRTDRLVQPPLHHAHAGRGDRPRRAAAARPARSR